MVAALIIHATVLCNNLNWEYSERCTAPVAEIHQTVNGFEGTLESGVYWKQTWVTPNMMLMEMEDVKYLVYKDKVVYID